MHFLQHPLTFACDGEWLVAIVSRPQQPRPRGVLIVVGGPSTVSVATASLHYWQIILRNKARR